MTEREYKTALFPGSFDPFTAGHEAIVEEGLRVFDKVVIAIGANTEKHGLLTAENRLRLIEDLYKDDERVEVVTYNSLTGDFCRERGIKFMLRGVRNTLDFEYERNIMQLNKQLYPEITTVLLFTPAHLSAVSSSAIREILHFGGDEKALMPSKIDLKDYL
ncbi:MAG: pantetheine-phosphate adenylyltransferase [Tidjanibacter sp.]|nr:pantetheine-phosphate adenylyltransferase [Tidjanibacter sp.]